MNPRNTQPEPPSNFYYTQKCVATLGAGFVLSGLTTYFGYTGYDPMTYDPEDEHPEVLLSMLVRGLLLAAGCVGMAVTGGAAIVSPAVTLPLDLGATIYRSANAAFFQPAKENKINIENKETVSIPETKKLST